MKMGKVLRGLFAVGCTLLASCGPPALAGERKSNLFLVDGAGGAGTIYLYNYELREIITSFPTPEAADGVNADALAYASDRGTLFYTNSNGTGLIYELDAQTGAVLGVPFDGLLASGGRPNTGIGWTSWDSGLAKGWIREYGGVRKEDRAGEPLNITWSSDGRIARHVMQRGGISDLRRRSEGYWARHRLP